MFASLLGVGLCVAEAEGDATVAVDRDAVATFGEREEVEEEEEVEEVEAARRSAWGEEVGRVGVV